MLVARFNLSWLLFILSSNVLAVEYLLPNNQWRIISLPAEPPTNSNTVEKVFGDDFGVEVANYGITWKLFLYDRASKKYQSLGKETPLEQGQGYWIVQKTGQAITLKMPEGSIDTPNNYSLALASFVGGTQWNLSGNPYSVPKRLGGFSVKTDNGTCSTITCDLNKANGDKILHNKVWTFDGNQYVTKGLNTILNPWEGFWIPALEGSIGRSLSLSYSILDRPDYRDAGGISELPSGWWGSMGSHPVKMASITNPEYPNSVLDGYRFYNGKYEGNPPYYQSIFGKLKITIDIFYPADIVDKRPTIFYISGWHNYHSEQVYSLLYFIASQGYNAVFLSYNQRGNDNRIRSDEGFLNRMVKAVTHHFGDMINKDKVGIIGHSMGAGSVFNLAQKIKVDDLGKKGFFLFTAAGATAYFQGGGAIDLPANTKMIVQTYNEEKNNRPSPKPEDNWDTDPRYSVNYLLNTNIGLTDKTYLYLPGDADHLSNHSTIKSPYNYDSGRYSFDALQQVGIFRPLKSLIEYSFNINTQWKKIGLPDDGISTMRKGPNNKIEYYSGDNPCLDLDDIEDSSTYKFQYPAVNDNVRGRCN